MSRLLGMKISRQGAKRNQTMEITINQILPPKASNKLTVLTASELIDWTITENCPCCDNQQMTPIITICHSANMALLECNACFSLTYSRQPSKLWIDNWYANSWNVPRNDLPRQADVSNTDLKFFQEIKKFGRESLNNIQVLDYGAGKGHKTKALLNRPNISLTALEPSKNRAARLRDLGIQTFETEDSITKSFDYIFSSHVLEHLISPKIFFQFAQKKLKPSGKIIVWVPSPRGELPHQTIFYIGHLHLYNPLGLIKAAEDAGLSATDFEMSDDNTEFKLVFEKLKTVKSVDILELSKSIRKNSQINQLIREIKRSADNKTSLIVWLSSNTNETRVIVEPCSKLKNFICELAHPLNVKNPLVKRILQKVLSAISYIPWTNYGLLSIQVSGQNSIENIELRWLDVSDFQLIYK